MADPERESDDPPEVIELTRLSLRIKQHIGCGGIHASLPKLRRIAAILDEKETDNATA